MTFLTVVITYTLCSLAELYLRRNERRMIAASYIGMCTHSERLQLFKAQETDHEARIKKLEAKHEVQV